MDALPVLLDERERKLYKSQTKAAAAEMVKDSTNEAPVYHCDLPPPPLPHLQAAKKDACDGVMAVQHGDLPEAVRAAAGAVVHEAAGLAERTFNITVPGGAPPGHAAGCSVDHMHPKHPSPPM